MRVSDDTIMELIERLSSGGVDAAWSEFLARYLAPIMHVIRLHDTDHADTAGKHDHGNPFVTPQDQLSTSIRKFDSLSIVTGGSWAASFRSGAWGVDSATYLWDEDLRGRRANHLLLKKPTRHAHPVEEAMR